MTDREHRQQVDQILDELWRAHNDVRRLSRSRLDALRAIDRAHDRGEDLTRLTAQARRISQQLSQAARRLEPLIRRLQDALTAWERDGVGREYQRFHDQAEMLITPYYSTRWHIRENLEHEEGIYEPERAR
jgi:hypothetical protein